MELIANPEKYDNKTVTVLGYLSFFHEKHRVIAAFLYLHEEDAKNLLPNEIVVVPSEQMLQDEEKIDRKYVILTGRFRAVRAGGNSPPEIGVIEDVVDCTPWSDPRRPIGEQDRGGGQLK